MHCACYFWFKYDLGQKYHAPPDHDSTFHRVTHYTSVFEYTIATLVISKYRVTHYKSVFQYTTGTLVRAILTHGPDGHLSGGPMGIGAHANLYTTMLLFFIFCFYLFIFYCDHGA